ncbi:hypothetical protein M422DRAFT_196495 [Sphaerobolus stellatus SS14]|uniref:Uncharacterized protein n=1 Tax=Sphaerobolus stellatus (strain SS14) TaxID=990650 RepID=A0A0C9T2G4_SPHS4|nr:hypothetical protein M422DRAFT_196495 [Sphaerobolus stellatus SS14]
MLPNFNVILIGAGEVNFGSVEGPWNHVRKLKDRLQIIALVDPDVDRAKFALESKSKGDQAASYVNALIAIKSMPCRFEGKDLNILPNSLVILGSPPQFRGSHIPGKDLELQIMEAFPGCPVFVEKPVTASLPEECWRVSKQMNQSNVLIGVGYVLRYLRAVQKIKEIIRENNLVVMGTNARYVMAYEYARKLSWWNKSLSGGPIIEQATHFCDLSRYFGGEVILDSVTAHTVEHDDSPGLLSAKRFDEDLIPPESRIPRLTSASWKYISGAVGSLMHVIALHDTTYDTEFEVYADGFRLKLVDPYGSPTLYLRRPGIKEEETYKFEEDDPFFSEISTFVDAIEARAPKHNILSSYEDALRTYEFTWQIREASDTCIRKPGNGI